MIWLVAGLVLGGFYGFVWALMFTSSESDDQAMAEWQRRQDHFRRPNR